MSSTDSGSQEGSAQGPNLLPLFPDAPFDIVVVAASFGGIPALREILARLPPSSSPPIAVVQHIGARLSNLADCLDLRSRIAVRFAKHGERLRACTIMVAPPDQHLTICERRRFSLSSCAKVNFTRPAADPLFDTASKAFGPRTLAIVLSGMGKDGAAGARLVKERGGVVLVQDPATAEGASMPNAVIRAGCADLVLGIEALAGAISSIVSNRTALALLGLPRVFDGEPRPSAHVAA